MARVRIEHLSDTYDNWRAEGARIFVDGEEVTCLEPIAHRTSGQSFDNEDIMRAVLKHFGHELELMTY